MKDLFSFSNIYRSYLKCRKKKRSTINALHFEAHLEDNLCRLENELKIKSYQPARSVCFVAKRPKFREIFAANFKDRVVHHILVGYLERIFEPKFIFDSYACRKGKGTHGAVKRLQKFTRQVTKNNTKQAFYLQMDVKSYFVNIDKGILFNLIKKRISNTDILWLADKIINNDCAKNYVFRGNPKLLKMVPPHKTLFNARENTGLPIGNLTSQFFANVYLNEMDQFIKHDLKVKHYIRYVDDFILLSENMEDLLSWKEKITNFISKNLKLEIHPKRQCLRPISNGIDFLGYIVRPDYLLVRRRVFNNCKLKLKVIKEKLEAIGGVGNIRSSLSYHSLLSEIKFLPKIVKETKESFSSYLAHFNFANSYNLKKAINEKFRFVSEFIKLYNLVRPHFFSCKLEQYDFFKRIFSEHNGSPFLFFFQEGYFYEFYGATALTAVEILGLRSRKNTYGCSIAGFPTRLEKKYAKIAVKKGYPVYVINQSDDFLFSNSQVPRVLTKKYLTT